MILRNKLLLLTLFLVVRIATFAQFPIGKNIKMANTEIKSFLKKSGFTYLEEHSISRDLFVIAYSEEFRVTLNINNYKNVETINFIAKKTSTFINLQRSLSFDKWKYIGEIKNQLNETESLYHYKNYKIRMDTRSQQFVVALISDF